MIIVWSCQLRFRFDAFVVLLSSEEERKPEKKQRSQISTSLHIEAQNQDENFAHSIAKSFRHYSFW